MFENKINIKIIPNPTKIRVGIETRSFGTTCPPSTGENQIELLILKSNPTDNIENTSVKLFK